MSMVQGPGRVAEEAGEAKKGEPQVEPGCSCNGWQVGVDPWSLDTCSRST